MADAEAAPEADTAGMAPGALIAHNQAHACYGEGRYLLVEGRPEAAVPKFSKAILLDSHVPRFYVQRAEAYVMLLDFKSAIVNLRKALELTPDDHVTKGKLANLLDAQGHLYLDEGSHAKAVTCFTEAISVVTLKASYWLHRALAFVGLGDFTKALHDVDQCLCMFANDANVIVLRAKLHEQLGDSEASSRDFRKAAALEPAHPEVLKFQQSMWEKTEHVFRAASDALLESSFGRAVRLLSEALHYSPDDMKIRLMRASAYRQLKSFDEALADVEHCARVYADAHSDEALAQWQSDEAMRGISDEAVQELVGDAAFEDDVKGRRRREEEARRKAEAEAQAAALKAANEANQHPEIIRQRNLIHNDMALAAMEAQDYGRAVTYFNRVLESELRTAERFEGNVIDPRFYVNRGDCHRLSGRYQQALADYHAAFDLHPDSWDVKTRLSMLHYQFGIELFNRGEFSQSEVEFAVACEYNPKVSVYYQHRSEACFYQSKFDEAHRMLTRAIKLDPKNNLLRAKLVQFSGRPAPPPQQPQQQQQQRPPPASPTRRQRGSPRRRERSDRRIRGLYDERADLAKADMSWLLDANTKMKALSDNVRGRAMPREGGVAPKNTFRVE